MKKLIFLLIPIMSFGQATITEVTLAGNFSTSGVGGFVATKTAGKLYIVFSATSNAGGTPATTSLSGTSETWTEIGTAGGVVQTTSGKRLQAFRFYATVTLTSNVTTVTYTGTQDGGWIMLYEITGADITGSNGANAIVQTVTGTDDATQDPNLTMAALANRASVITAWVNDVNPPAGTPESGWTETEDNGYATPTTGGYLMSRQNTTDNTPSWTAGAFSNWAGMAIEIKNGLRRVFTIN